MALWPYDPYSAPYGDLYSAQPPQRYQTVPASHAGDARAILCPGGDFTNLDKQLDNLNGYNLVGTGFEPTALNDSPVHDLMQGGAVHSMMAGSAFNTNRLANGGMIQGPGTCTSDSLATVANPAGHRQLR